MSDFGLNYDLLTYCDFQQSANYWPVWDPFHEATSDFAIIYRLAQQCYTEVVRVWGSIKSQNETIPSSNSVALHQAMLYFGARKPGGTYQSFLDISFTM